VLRDRAPEVFLQVSRFHVDGAGRGRS
jgi:hypothetical protein